MENSRAGGHETSDVGVAGVWYSGLGLIVVSVVIMLLVAGMYHLLQRWHDSAESDNVNVAVSNAMEKFPGPRLQVAPEVDMVAFRAREDAELQSYAWINRKAGIVRLPIERAMDLIIQRGLPVRGQPGAPPPARTLLDMQQARPKQIAPSR